MQVPEAGSLEQPRNGLMREDGTPMEAHEIEQVSVPPGHWTLSPTSVALTAPNAGQ